MKRNGLNQAGTAIKRGSKSCRQVRRRRNIQDQSDGFTSGVRIEITRALGAERLAVMITGALVKASNHIRRTVGRSKSGLNTPNSQHLNEHSAPLKASGMDRLYPTRSTPIDAHPQILALWHIIQTSSINRTLPTSSDGFGIFLFHRDTQCGGSAFEASGTAVSRRILRHASSVPRLTASFRRRPKRTPPPIR